MGKVSANPSELVGWAGWAQGLNGNLNGSARDLNDAIEAFNKAPQSPQFTPPVAYVGNDVIAYATQNGTVDAWVGQVGQAFAAVDHAGIPGGVYRANQQDFFDGVNTASESALMALVGGDPVQQARSAAAGARLAAEVQEAQDSGDSAKVQALLAQLENTDREFDATFFEDLGPDRTIKLLIEVAASKDQNLLRIFDTALARATNDPSWDPAFTKALLDPQRGAWSGLPTPGVRVMQLDLLRYGTYSGDFLTRAADYFLFTPGDPVPDIDVVVFNALARNPNAAYTYLTGDVDVVGQNLPRVQGLLTLENDGEGNLQALGKLIDAAGFSTAGRADGANQLLRDIGSIPSANEVDDALRPSIERLLAGYIGNFSGFDPVSKDASSLYNQGQFTWQERLFEVAELNQDGTPNASRMQHLASAVAQWVTTNLQDHPHRAGAVFKDAGNLFGLALLTQRKALWNGYDLAALRMQMATFLAGGFAAFLPGGAPVALLSGTVITIASGYLGPSVGNTQVSDYDTVQSGKAIATATLIMYMAAKNPDLLPPALQGKPMFVPDPHHPGARELNPADKPYLQALENQAMDPNSNSFDGLGLSPSEAAAAGAWASRVGMMSVQMQFFSDIPVDALS